MDGLMQAWSLTLDKILTNAARVSGDRAIVWRDADGEVKTSTYREALVGAHGFSAALLAHGVVSGDRVATMMWNNYDHLVAWYGVMGIGAIVHTLNPRLHPDQIAWIARHGGARVLVVEKEFLGLLGAIADRLPDLELVVVSDGPGSATRIGAASCIGYEEFASQTASVLWGDFNEEAAAGLCYTSGTTGDPKGVLYSHRSNFIHAMSVNQPNGLAIAAKDVVLPVVPMFHANAWALAFVAPMAGAELVLPGRQLDGASLVELINARGVTIAVGVPTVWEGLLSCLRETGKRVPSLRRIVVGGSAVSAGIVQEFGDSHGVEVVHAWGMTEMSPLGTITSAVPSAPQLPPSERLARALRQGGALFPVEVEIFDENGEPCLHNDQSAGALKVRGPTVARAYFGAAATILDGAGWFDTGDIAAIDGSGSVRLVDRAKDVIKSGGEWISSIELENLAMTCPGVRRAAVVAIEDERWGERPLLVIETDGELGPTPILIVEHLRDCVPKWWLPSHFAYCEIPIGATGKMDKKALRQCLASPDAPEIVLI
ncbi:long-chain-fatty-acid--CoA ligase [Sphingomonas sp. RT2P30]|uniref:long-chain-fatty-acid--CoA ligase n=1 Tax=Parasphingomonas halimpatiens TaxID=3096162 RepID=UPI002FCA1F9A